MSERVRRVIGSSTMLVGHLAADKLSTLAGVAPYTCPSDIGSVAGAVGIGPVRESPDAPVGVP